jgi:hypothetical protein
MSPISKSRPQGHRRRDSRLSPFAENGEPQQAALQNFLISGPTAKLVEIER